MLVKSYRISSFAPACMDIHGFGLPRLQYAKTTARILRLIAYSRAWDDLKMCHDQLRNDKRPHRVHDWFIFILQINRTHMWKTRKNTCWTCRWNVFVDPTSPFSSTKKWHGTILFWYDCASVVFDNQRRPWHDLRLPMSIFWWVPEGFQLLRHVTWWKKGLKSLGSHPVLGGFSQHGNVHSK